MKLIQKVIYAVFLLVWVWLILFALGVIDGDDLGIEPLVTNNTVVQNPSDRNQGNDADAQADADADADDADADADDADADADDADADADNDDDDDNDDDQVDVSNFPSSEVPLNELFELLLGLRPPRPGRNNSNDPINHTADDEGVGVGGWSRHDASGNRTLHPPFPRAFVHQDQAPSRRRRSHRRRRFSLRPTVAGGERQPCTIS